MYALSLKKATCKYFNNTHRCMQYRLYIYIYNWKALILCIVHFCLAKSSHGHSLSIWTWRVVGDLSVYRKPLWQKLGHHQKKYIYIIIYIRTFDFPKKSLSWSVTLANIYTTCVFFLIFSHLLDITTLQKSQNTRHLFWARRHLGMASFLAPWRTPPRYPGDGYLKPIFIHTRLRYCLELGNCLR